MLIKRIESWGYLEYDTNDHKFIRRINKLCDREIPYSDKPIVLNCDLTLKCNMDCKYCVAKDMKKFASTKSDLNITNNLINQINKSDFLVIVITGGEPLLIEYEGRLLKLINSLKKKGIIIDTNGTITPSDYLIKVLIKKNVLLRISLDSPRPKDEYEIRILSGDNTKNKVPSKKLYEKKLKIIKKLKSKGLKLAIQSVLHGKNRGSIMDMPRVLQSWSIKYWHIQRYIPSYKLRDNFRFNIKIDEYEELLNKLSRESKKYGVTCITKSDRRHNSVFLLVGDGDIYTQSDNFPGEKIYLGKIGEIEKYFEMVSASEHAMRYYGST